VKAIVSALALVMAIGAAERACGQALARISVDSAGVAGNRDSGRPALSADGRLVAFESDASNLVVGDTNGATDVFVHDLVTGVTERVSVDSSGGEANDYSAQPALSADGRFVAFLSLASNLVAGDGNAIEDVFVHDRATGATVRVSVDSAGVEGDDYSAAPSLSADGQVVSFDSFATNLVAGDTNGNPDVFVHDLASGATERVSVDSAGAEGNWYSYAFFGALSADGQVVVFESGSSNLVAGDFNGVRDVFVHERTTGATVRVSVDSAGIEGDHESASAVLASDARIVAFESAATNLAAGDTNLAYDVFVHDRVTGATERVSVDSAGVEGDADSFAAALSADGASVAFTSVAANLVAGDGNRTGDVFRHDRATGRTERVSVTDQGVEGDGWSGDAALAADGTTVVFASDASNLVANDDGLATDVFVRLPCASVASWSNYGAGFPGTLGIPTFTSRADPVLGTTLDCDLASSSGLPSIAIVVIGLQRADLPSSWGGHLLVLPFVTELLALPSSGVQFGGAIPGDASLCGLVVDLQALELDPGAARGVAFTPGLALSLGR
jgi:Tol biopolymer transport system component